MSQLEEITQLIKSLQPNKALMNSSRDRITQIELSFIHRGLFDQGKQVPPAVITEAIHFYEKLYLANIVNRDFDENMNVFSKLSYVYDFTQNLSGDSINIISLHMMYLISVDKMKDYHSIYEGLDESYRALPQISQIDGFSGLLNIGNYVQAQHLVENLSPFHQILLENI